MKQPQPGYGKNHAIKWLNVGNDETMWSGAMTKEEAERVARDGHWNRHASPMVVKLGKEKPNATD